VASQIGSKESIPGYERTGVRELEQVRGAINRDNLEERVKLEGKNFQPVAPSIAHGSQER